MFDTISDDYLKSPLYQKAVLGWSDKKIKAFRKAQNYEGDRLLSVRKRSYVLGFESDLTIDDISFSGNCPICEKKFTPPNGEPFGRQTSQPSIDRKNPKLGYTKNNISVICASCNRIKNDLRRHQIGHFIGVLNKIDTLDDLDKTKNLFRKILKYMKT